jgi:hemerythrin-like domain-containing protein
MNRGKNLSEIRQLADYFRKEMAVHMKQEERVLFPFLCTHIPRLQPMVRLLAADHDEFRTGMQSLGRNLKTQKAHQISEQGTYLVCLLSSHMWVESHSLYKAADKELRPEEKKTLIRWMKAGRKPS